MLKGCPSVGLWPSHRFRVRSADFDGSDSMARGGNLTGIADSKSGILSAWVRLDGLDSEGQILFYGAGPVETEGMAFRRSAGNLFIVEDNNAGATFQLLSVGTYTAGATWRHVLAAWDGATGAKHLYIDGVSDLDPASLSNNVNVEYTDCTNWLVGDDGFGRFFNGCMAELYFAPGQYLDLSVAGNRALFRKADGRPADLGENGATPTGTAPRVYQSLRLADAATAFVTNRGTGGNFTMSSGDVLTFGSTSPTD